MPVTINEGLILLCVLAGTLLCIPLIAIARLWLPAGKPGGWGDALWPYQQPREPAPPQVQWHTQWERRDAILALSVTGLLSLLMGPVTTSMAQPGNAPLTITADRLAMSLIFQLSMAGFVLFFLSRGGTHPLTKLGIRTLRPPQALLEAVLWIIPVFLFIAVIGNAMNLLMGHYDINIEEQAIVQAMRKVDSPSISALFIVGIALGAPLMEEIVFRGLLYRVACRYSNVPVATLLSAVFFAIVHNNLLSLLPLTLLGIAFAMAYERTKSLLVPFFMHSLFNLTQFLLMKYAPSL